MHGVLKHGKTTAVYIHEHAHLIADEEAKDPSERCDGDHLFGHDTRYLNVICLSEEYLIRRHFFHQDEKECTLAETLYQ